MTTDPGRSGGRRRTLTSVVVGVLVLVVGLAGVLTWQAVGHDDVRSAGPSPVATPTRPAGPLPTVAPDLRRFSTQRLHWSSCPGGQCARLQVPLDYDHPDGRAISLKVLRVPARDQAHRIGALVINPGGPGGSGVQYAQAATAVFGEPVLDHYDVVGFDPRGVGASTPLQCVGTAQLDALVSYDPDPDTAAERDHLDELVHRFGAGCVRHDAGLARHMSTQEVARDMDILRGALRQPKLDYFGASYGTFIGATYANLFPRHVGRMVLDGAIDPALSNLQLSLAQAHGFEVALQSYVASCVDAGNCVLGDTVDAAVGRVQRLLADIERSPLPTGTDRPLTVGLATLGIWSPLYVKTWWPLLTKGLTEAIREHRGATLLSLADAYISRGPDGYTDNSLNALYDVNCLDHDDYIPTAQVPRYFGEFEKASPTFGKDFAFSLSTCSTWPVRSGQHSQALHAPGAPPILVLGTTRDPATPLAWAQGLASELDSGVLVTRDGDGHTAYHRGNGCIDALVESYLVAGKVPRNGTSC
ncbi:MAG: alpha/beta hydrolase [Marmoricola sp.]